MKFGACNLLSALDPGWAVDGIKLIEPAAGKQSKSRGISHACYPAGSG